MSGGTIASGTNGSGEVALAVGGCCGPAAGEASAVTGTVAATCCGTVAEARESGACCAEAAKADAVAAGAGCCG